MKQERKSINNKRKYCSFIEKIKKNDKFIDYHLKTKKGTIGINKLVVSSQSKYFENALLKIDVTKIKQMFKTIISPKTPKSKNVNFDTNNKNRIIFRYYFV